MVALNNKLFINQKQIEIQIQRNKNKKLSYLFQDCHGSFAQNNAAPIQDDTQNYIVLDGHQNGTHTQVEFYRQIETCDPYDIPLGVSE